jgi:hypothetical protein
MMIMHIPQDRITTEEIEELKKLVHQLTSGPWKSFVEGREEMSGSSFIMTGGNDIYLKGASDFDQDFIAYVRNIILRLISEIEFARKEEKR